MSINCFAINGCHCLPSKLKILLAVMVSASLATSVSARCHPRCWRQWANADLAWKCTLRLCRSCSECANSTPQPTPSTTPVPAPPPQPTSSPVPAPSPAPIPATPCVKTKRGWYCIPCAIFNGPCQRDSTVLSSMIFPPTQHCPVNGQCGRYFRSIRVAGVTYRKPPQNCMIYNDGEWLSENTSAGYCLCDPLKRYSYTTMKVRGSKAVYAAAFKYSIEQSGASLACSSQSFCHGHGVASGILGTCTCACTDGYSGVRCDLISGQRAFSSGGPPRSLAQNSFDEATKWHTWDKEDFNDTLNVDFEEMHTAGQNGSADVWI